MPTASIIIRTKNEEKGLPLCLNAIKKQKYSDYEIIVVDSGSKDKTIKVAEEHGCKTVLIPEKDFSFGYSLNVGIKEAKGEIMVIISAHCLPANNDWLSFLIKPFFSFLNLAGVYGRHVPYLDASPQEKRGLAEAFPPGDEIRFYENDRFSNANSAILKSAWESINFDEKLPGAEDIGWCMKIKENGLEVAYEPRAIVFHSHAETLKSIYKRFYRETRALLDINSSFVKKHNLFGYFARTIRSIGLDYIFIFKNPLSMHYFIKWFFYIPFYRITIYYGQYKASKK